MPGEVIDRPNPGPMPSHIPDIVDGLLVKREKSSLPEDVRNSLLKFRRAANYIAGGGFSYLKQMGMRMDTELL